MNKPKILVVGSIYMDLVMHGVEREPKTGESVYCNSYQYATGGKGSNQAYAAAMLGADTSLVGRIGTDENGKRILEQLYKAEVKTEYVVTDPEHLTGLSTMNIYPDGTYFSIGATGANQYISPEDVKKALDAEPFEMVLMQLEMPLETVYATYEMAKERGIPVFLDAGPAMRIPLDRLKGIFILSPNEAEAEAMTGIRPDTEAHILETAETLYEEAKPQYVILKLGKRGAFLYDGKEGQLIEGFRVPAVDSTAAGDTFGAALAVRYCKGSSIEEAIRFGHAAAAICVTREGGQISIPSAEEAFWFYEEKTGRKVGMSNDNQ
ncbi:MAG: ribokinase [Lachnospiraceae bacterium]|nr:ribokinase [Lachnospiraceae bacterium]